MIISKDYPDGTEKVIRLLEIFPALKRKQVALFLMQEDLTFNELRVENLLNEIEEMGLLSNKDGIVSLYKQKPYNASSIEAFWVFLNYVTKGIVFDEGRYPAEIVFKENNTVSEIIVCNDDFTEKMDFLSKRKKRKNDCKYYILLTKDNIEELDEELFPDTSFTVITMQSRSSDVPKLMYHEVYTEEKVG